MCSVFTECLEYQAVRKTLTLKERKRSLKQPFFGFVVMSFQFGRPNLNMSENGNKKMDKLQEVDFVLGQKRVNLLETHQNDREFSMRVCV